MLGVVTGLAMEAAAFRAGWGARAPAIRTGYGLRAGDAARALLDDGATALVSFGQAGGLAPGLAAGTLVVAETILAERACYRLAVAAPIAARLEARIGVLQHAAAPLLSSADKAASRRDGALAVDMESAHVVAAAAAAAVPALVVRAIADPATRSLPRLAAVAVDDAGRIRAGSTATALLRWPGDWPRVWASAGDSARARRSLRGAALRLADLAGEGLLERLLDVPVEDVSRRPLP